MSIGTLDAAARKKQLGQYFTHQRVGRLLAALAGAETARTIIDPMVGSADLLRSCLSIGAHPKKLVGVELDPLALDQARAELDGVDGSELIQGDAFSVELPPNQFDLVITNPPYIRYQSKGQINDLNVPTSTAVRAGLVHAIKNRTGFSDEERDLWLRAATTYPGTSDIAVPAWILSAALVREDGVLAVVAPQAWLSRNYAHAVRELLDRAFDVEVIVEDGDVDWFEDAQVRTQLVVARRRRLNKNTTGHSVVRACATRDLRTHGVLRGDLASEAAVAKSLRQVASSHSLAVTTGLTAYVEHGFSVAASGTTVQVPARVAAALGVATSDVATRTLESYGWRTGQGLRTGANEFFYVRIVDGEVRPDNRWGLGSLEIPSVCLLPAVRRQSELGPSPSVDASQLSSRIVNFRGWVAAADLKRVDQREVQVLPSTVSRWIAQVSETPFSVKDPTKLFPNLAAVATNSRNDHTGQPVGFWYQLPELAARHRPTLFLGRVCGGRPRTYLNEPGIVVDANFSGLWPVTSNAMSSEALLALLNSSWTWVNLESTCTVLGGGALKIEATDLRRLALPDLSPTELNHLTSLGRSAAKELSSSTLRAIDDVIVGSLMRGLSDAGDAAQLRALGERALANRSRT